MGCVNIPIPYTIYYYLPELVMGGDGDGDDDDAVDGDQRKVK